MTLTDDRHKYEVFMRNNPCMSEDDSSTNGDYSVMGIAESVGRAKEPDTSTGSNCAPERQTKPNVTSDNSNDELLREITDDELLEQETLAAALALSDLYSMPEHILFPHMDD
ncbi:hypothetical protein DVH05_011042 [Phytophthora capsici]|nr:hypothetical protein DVH05_011042 [Phytophthora capsici]